MSSTRDALCMCDLCRKRAAAYSRTEAFAAIRRAATIARKMDKSGDLTDDGDFYEIDMAEGARRAIRAAIGSEKAS